MLMLQELEVFVMVAEQGSFSRAGEMLNLSQPAVSQTIQALETRFGAELFIRHRRGVLLTDAGEALLPMAQELLTNARRVEENMGGLQGAVVGKLTVGCSTASGKYLLPRLIARFRRRFSRVRVDVAVRDRRRMFDMLLAGQVHFAVSSKRIEHSEIEYLPFYADEVVLIVAADHPWAKFGRVYPDDLLDVPLILREDGSGTSESVFQGLLHHDITPDMLNVVMVLGNAEAIAMAVEERIGVAFVSRLVAQRSIALGQVAEVAVEGMTLKHELHFARNLRLPSTRSQTEFWDFVQDGETLRDSTQSLKDTEFAETVL